MRGNRSRRSSAYSSRRAQTATISRESGSRAPWRRAAAARRRRSSHRIQDSVSREPSGKTTVASSRFSTVFPYTSDRAPAELFPIIPPRFARFEVEVSGPNRSPSGASAAPSASCTTPGWTRAQSSSRFTSRTRWNSVERSRTTASPTACPASEVPPPRGSTGAPASAAVRTASATSPAWRGITTPSGSIW